MSIRSILTTAVLGACLASTLWAAPSEAKSMNKDFQTFVQQFVSKAAPLEKERNLASFKADNSGKKEDYDKAAELEINLNRLYADKATFEKLKAFRDAGKITDPLLRRQLEVLYNACLSLQIDPARMEAMVRLQNGIQQKFNTFRVTVDGKQLTDNDVEDTLKTSTDSSRLKAVYLASKNIGKQVADDILALVRLRNETAKDLGFSNYHEMSLKLGEQDPAEIEKLFDELDARIQPVFQQVKSEMDAYLAKRCGIPTAELMPWHYQNRFFQAAPQIYSVDLDSYYKGKDLVGITRDFYKGIDLPVQDLMAKSDLFERAGKYQHAYCSDIDRAGDVRVVCNVKDNESWMGTLLHEYGHAVYDKFLDPRLPWLLRSPAHTFTTEAVAMYFGRLSSDPSWLVSMVHVKPEESKKIADDSFRSLRLAQVVFSRWAQVMYRFEKELYKNPEQDLNALWWNLVEKYQGLHRPEGREGSSDWASKIHIATVPCYYHNYQLGELLASQFQHYIQTSLLKGPGTKEICGQKAIGGFFKEKVFGPGARLFWDEMIKAATGEKLTPRYYAEQFLSAR